MLNKIYYTMLYAGLTLLMVFPPLARGATTTRLWAITPVLLVMYALVFLWLLRIVNDDSKKNGTVRIHVSSFIVGTVPIFLLIVIAVVSFVFSIYKHDSFYALLRLLGYVGLFYVIVYNYSRKMRWHLVGLAIIIGVCISVYGLLQYFGVFPHNWWEPKDLLAGTYVNHNHFAGYLEMVIPVAVGVVLGCFPKKMGQSAPKFIRWLVGTVPIFLVIMIGAFIFAQSRGAWASLGISLFVMNVILIKRGALRQRSIIVMLLIATGVFGYFYTNKSLVSKRIESIVDIAQGEASMETRLAMWQGTTKMIASHPWTGVGIGCFQWGFSKYRPEELGRKSIRPRYAHNDYLHMASEMGVLGVVFMILILVLIIARGLKYVVKKPKDYGQHMINNVILGCGIGMLSLALHGLIDFNFHIPANMILFVVLGGIVIGESRNNI